MRIPRTLRAGVLIAAAVVLGLLAVQGTYALWNASTSAAPGSITSASFDISLTDGPSGQATNMTLSSGHPASLNLTPSAKLAPGTPVYASVTVSNSTRAGGTFNTSIMVEKAIVTNAGRGALADHITVSAKNVPTSAECSTLSGYAPLTAAGLTSPAVPKTASTVLCFQVSLIPSTPSSVKGQAVNISLPITARQLCGVPSGCA